MKFSFCNEENSYSYKGLAKVDDACEGLEVSIILNINYDTSLGVCKVPSTLEGMKIRLLKAVRKVRIL